MAAIAQTVSPMIAAETLPPAGGAGDGPAPAPKGNLLKLKKAAAALFEAEEVEVTDLSYLQLSIAHILGMAVKTRKVPTGDKETYVNDKGEEKTRAVTKEAKVVQLTIDYDTFFGAVTDAPVDYRVTDATIPVGGIASRVMKAKEKAKAPKAPKAPTQATPTKAATAAAAEPGAPVKAAKAEKPKKAKVPKAPKAPALPVLTDEQLEELMAYRDPKTSKPIAPKAHVRTLKEHLERMGVPEAQYKQARADWIAYRASHEPEAPASLLDDAKLEYLRALNLGPRIHARNKHLAAALKEWGISEADHQQAAEEYRTWAKEVGVESPKGSKPGSPKAAKASAAAAASASASASAVAPPAVRVPADEEEDDDEEGDEDLYGSPVSEGAGEGDVYDTALEAIGDAGDLGELP